MAANYKTPPIFVPKGDVTELVIEDLENGDGEEVKSDSVVEVHYQGNLLDGTVFDSSYKRGEPSQFALNQVIEGWQKGLLGMKVGGTRRLTIPYSLAYGERGAGGKIGPCADLVFHIQLIGILN